MDSRAARILDGVALAILLLALALAPLPIGSESPWAQGLVFIVIATAAALWALAGALRGSWHIPRTAALVFVVLFLLIGLLQITPLPAQVVGLFSPGAQAAREQAFGAGGAPAAGTISLCPNATRVVLFRYGAYALMFVLLASVLRTRRAIVWTVAVLLAAGVFQVIYALLDHAVGSHGDYVFWVRKTHYLGLFSGTFFNKNHFAGYLEMLLPLAAALVVAIRGRHDRGRFELASDWIAETLSDPATHKRLLLAAVPVLLAVGIVMSVSRSGVVCAFAALAFLAGVAVVRRGRSRAGRTLVLLLIALSVVVAVVASGPLIAGFQQEMDARMPSTMKRLDIVRSAWYLARDFPILGTGLGTTGSVFGRYQSLNLGNVEELRYLANDWAQVTCEAGFVGLLTVGIGLGWFALSTLRAARRRAGRFAKWVAIGCLAGAFAMALHSVTDFNLVRTMSNGLLFAALLALAHAAARADGPDGEEGSPPAHRDLTIAWAPARVLFALVLIAPLLWLCAAAGRLAVADIRFNYYLHYAGKPTGSYFFLPLPGAVPPNAKTAAEFDLAEAARLEPQNPAYAHAWGEMKFEEVERRITEVTESIARRNPLIVRLRKKKPEDFRQLVRSFRAAAYDELADEVRETKLLDDAEAGFRRAIRLEPTVGRHHLSLARTLLLKARMPGDAPAGEVDALRQEVARELGRTTYFGHNVPYLLVNAAHALVSEAFEVTGEARDEKIASAAALLSRAMRGAPVELATGSFGLLEGAGFDDGQIIDATPNTVLANLFLYDFFREQQKWAKVVVALDRMEAAAGQAPADGTEARSAVERLETPPPPKVGAPEAMPPLFNWTSRAYAGDEFKLDITRRRARALGFDGKWAERSATLHRYTDLANRHVAAAVRRAKELRQAGRHRAARVQCEAALARAPHNVDALIEMARVTTIPHHRDLASEAYAPLACLFRAVVNNPALEPRQCADLTAALDGLRALSAREQRTAELIASAAILSQPGGRAGAGSRTTAIHRLEKLAARTDPEVSAWRQRHLVSYYLGVGRERQGKPDAARAMYERAIELVPTHRPSLLALARLAETEEDAAAAAQIATRLAALEPQFPCAVTFGGQLRLLGYSVVPPDPGRDVPGLIRHHWEFLEPVLGDYVPQTYVLDYRWRALHRDERAIAAGSSRYPLRLARSGEVVIEARPLPANLANARYVAFGIRASRPPKGRPEWLPQDLGGPKARFALLGIAPR